MNKYFANTKDQKKFPTILKLKKYNATPCAL
jgi:hypothetical protein